MGGCSTESSKRPDVERIRNQTAKTPTIREKQKVDVTPDPNEKVITTPSGLKYVDKKVGTGKEAKKGDRVSVDYAGYFKDGTVFDSSMNHGKPYQLTLGAGMVIKGWDEGIVGMKEGGKRKLIIPYELAYGEMGGRGIPPRSELTFDLELVKVE
jgi:peptidylprolyl isomerase